MNLEKVTDPLTRRLLEFVKSKGGPSQVARAIGKKPAMFYLMVSGQNKRPSSETLDLLSKNYDDFSIEHIMSGITSNEDQDLRAIVKRLSSELDRLNGIIKERDVKIEKLEQSNQGYIDDLRKIALNFQESSSFSTAEPNFAPLPKKYEPIGFRLPSGPLDILRTIGCIQDENGVWGVPDGEDKKG